MGALWQANGISLTILESQSKIFRSVIFWKEISTAPTRNLKARGGRRLASERNLFSNSKIASKIFQVLDFLERDLYGASKES